VKNSGNEAEIEKLFITTCEKILMALLEGELQNNVLAKRVGITQQHLSRLLPKLQRNDLIVSRFLNVRRINSLTTKGKIIAGFALQKKKAIVTCLSPKRGLISNKKCRNLPSHENKNQQL